jgi:hypothetical protein
MTHVDLSLAERVRLARIRGRGYRDLLLYRSLMHTIHLSDEMRIGLLIVRAA